MNDAPSRDFILNAEIKLIEQGVSYPFQAIVGDMETAIALFDSEQDLLADELKTYRVRVGTEWKDCLFVGKISRSEIFVEVGV